MRSSSIAIVVTGYGSESETRQGENDGGYDVRAQERITLELSRMVQLPRTDCQHRSNRVADSQHRSARGAPKDLKLVCRRDVTQSESLRRQVRCQNRNRSAIAQVEASRSQETRKRALRAAGYRRACVSETRGLRYRRLV